MSRAADSSRRGKAHGFALLSLSLLLGLALLIVLGVSTRGSTADVDRILVVNGRALDDMAPALSLRQQHLVAAVVTRAHMITSITRGHPFHMVPGGSWTAPNGVLLGELIRLEFSHPQVLSGRWQSIVLGCSPEDSTSYSSTSYYARVTDVRDLVILVRIQPAAVVSVAPVPASTGIISRLRTPVTAPSCRFPNGG